MYELKYRDLKTNKKRVFLLVAESLVDADKKMRSVYEDELKTSILVKCTKLQNQSAA